MGIGRRDEINDISEAALANQSEFSAVGQNMLRGAESTHSECPRCAHTIEDSAHVIKGRGAGASLIWDQAITEGNLSVG